MLELKIDEKGEVVLFGRFDASQVDKAKSVFNDINASKTVDFGQLDYISSAGLGVLLLTQKRLKDNGHQLILKNMNKHIREVFKYAGFDMIFQIE
jgi:anti-sigma B factor antagonist